ncbi:hypothetical protein QQ008_00310 [Fulvivirgaceae bacterium BMA10]|uniref:Outer membrane protein beta-barrel domain-containing protein n=1 Tax=Splendidivirga corallicola TaxID=3051826 RepID=A0ABT8KJK3_9BACT|nr:hypothetical protein [Fulvivirgaceae bacterium BMA10]
MKSIKLTVLFILIVQIAQGQDKYDDNSIKTLSGTTGHSGGFGALSFKMTKLKDETVPMFGVRGGWIINRSLAIGLEGYGVIPSAKLENISPVPNEKSIILGGYGGLFLEPIFFSNQVIHFTFPISTGAGWLGYHTDWESENYRLGINNDLIDEDVFWYIEPGVSAELNVAKSFRLAMGMSYRVVQDLELKDTDNQDFNNLSYFLTLKIGKF